MDRFLPNNVSPSSVSAPSPIPFHLDSARFEKVPTLSVKLLPGPLWSVLNVVVIIVIVDAHALLYTPVKRLSLSAYTFISPCPPLLPLYIFCLVLLYLKASTNAQQHATSNAVPEPDPVGWTRGAISSLRHTSESRWTSGWLLVGCAPSLWMNGTTRLNRLSLSLTLPKLVYPNYSVRQVLANARWLC